MLVDYSSDEEVADSPDLNESKVTKVSPIETKQAEDLAANQEQQSLYKASSDLVADPLSKRKPHVISFQTAKAPLLDVLEVIKPVYKPSNNAFGKIQAGQSQAKPEQKTSEKPAKLLPSQVRLKKHNTPIDI